HDPDLSGDQSVPSWLDWASSPPTLPVAAFALPLVLAWLCTALMLRAAPHLGLVDLPSARKVHRTPPPEGGGLAIYLALALTVAVLPPARTGETTLLLLVGGAIVLLGLVDDLRPLPWQLRLGVQTVAAVGIVLGGLSETGWVFRVVAVLWIVGLINAF